MTMPPEFGVRREGPATLDDVGEDAGLVERIRTEIRATGPMPFARFMDLSLYDADGGYYRGPASRPGRAGDFITAPELHPIFGATLATGILQIRDRLGAPVPFTIREYGAGGGALARPMLAEIRDAEDREHAEVAVRSFAELFGAKHPKAVAKVVFKLLEAAQEHWRCVNGPHLVALVRAGATFEKGVLVERPAEAAREVAA